jgi:hypothetical protein
VINISWIFYSGAYACKEQMVKEKSKFVTNYVMENNFNLKKSKQSESGICSPRNSTEILTANCWPIVFLFLQTHDFDWCVRT